MAQSARESEATDVDPGASMSAAISELDRTAERARQSVDRAIGQPTPAPSASSTSGTRSGPTPTLAATAASVGSLSRDSTLDEAASALADDLLRIPGIQRFGAMRLGDLDAAGPRPLRTMWRVARDRLASQYGEMTIGEIIDRYRSSGGDRKSVV